MLYKAFEFSSLVLYIISKNINLSVKRNIYRNSNQCTEKKVQIQLRALNYKKKWWWNAATLCIQLTNSNIFHVKKINERNTNSIKIWNMSTQHNSKNLYKIVYFFPEALHSFLWNESVMVGIKKYYANVVPHVPKG